VLPRDAHAIERAGREVLDQHVARLEQAIEHRHAALLLGVDRERALVVVEHREVEAVDARDVAQLSSRGVALARPLDLDHVRTQPRQKLRARRSGLDVGEVENANACERL
jgi:ABC-type uncharacterized transport system ATPase subunit